MSFSTLRYRWNAQYIAVMIVNPRRSPSTGESTMNTRIFRMPAPMSECQPAWATAAPVTPPTSAWEELVGKPKYHVMRSHRMAPTIAEKMTPIVMTF